MKTLDNYFNNWIKINVGIHKQPTAYKVWCEKNFGIQGLVWDVVFDNKFNSYQFRFKHQDDAIMFRLKFDGNQQVT